MQSSSNVIKATIIESKETVSPPIMEKLYKKTHNERNTDLNIDEICNSIINEANKKAQDIIKKNEIEGNKIILDANNKKKEIYNEALENGYQDGYKKGYTEGFEYGKNEVISELLKQREETDEYIKNCYTEVRNYIKKSEQEVIRLAVSIAKQIINTELTINSDAIFKLAESVVTRSVNKKMIILKVNPKDVEIIKKRKNELSIFMEDPNSIFIIADTNINQGSILAETPSGFIDGSIDVQFDILLKKLLGE